MNIASRVASRWLASADVKAEADKIREGTPPEHLPEVARNLAKYLKLRQLNELQYGKLPDDLRREIGSRDPMDVFIEMMEDEETMSGYDAADENLRSWSFSDIEDLVDALK